MNNAATDGRKLPAQGSLHCRITPPRLATRPSPLPTHVRRTLHPYFGARDVGACSEGTDTRLNALCIERQVFARDRTTDIAIQVVSPLVAALHPPFRNFAESDAAHSGRLCLHNWRDQHDGTLRSHHGLASARLNCMFEDEFCGLRITFGFAPGSFS